MSTTRGIFESFPNQPTSQRESPFAIVNDGVEPASQQAGPFAPANRQESPFSVVDEPTEVRQVEPGRPAKVPERRRTESPFQVADPAEGFGFEAPAKPQQSPFEAPAGYAQPPASPFGVPQQQPQPFSVESPRQTAPAAPAAAPEPPVWPEAAAAFGQQQAQGFGGRAFSQPSAAVQVPSAFAPAAPPAAPMDQQSDSFSIRQLELRAIFGVDREMTPDEILQRTRALPGMRNIARVGAQEMATLEALKTLLPNLGFGNGALKLYSGSVPLEFIREGPVLLAVQTDGGFAPGVRETLMLVARELAKA